MRFKGDFDSMTEHLQREWTQHARANIRQKHNNFMCGYNLIIKFIVMRSEKA